MFTHGMIPKYVLGASVDTKCTNSGKNKKYCYIK